MVVKKPSWIWYLQVDLSIRQALSGNPLAMHLGVRLLTYLKQHPQVYEELNQKGAYLKEGIQDILNEYNLPYQIHQCGSLLTLFFTDHTIKSYRDVKDIDQKAFVSYFQYLYDHAF